MKRIKMNKVDSINIYILLIRTTYLPRFPKTQDATVGFYVMWGIGECNKRISKKVLGNI